MKIKPHKLRGRFYNNPQDSLTRHIKSVVGTVLHLLKKKFHFRHKKRPFFEEAFKHHEWFTLTIPQRHSHDPLITWLGHATFLIQIGGLNILTDPLFFNLTPLLQRTMPLPLSLDQLPPIDVILISHNHPNNSIIQVNCFVNT